MMTAKAKEASPYTRPARLPNRCGLTRGSPVAGRIRAPAYWPRSRPGGPPENRAGAGRPSTVRASAGHNHVPALAVTNRCADAMDTLRRAQDRNSPDDDTRNKRVAAASNGSDRPADRESGRTNLAATPPRSAQKKLANPKHPERSRRPPAH